MAFFLEYDLKRIETEKCFEPETEKNKLLAGVKRSKPMLFREADKQNTNPLKDKNNCQTCVPCFEARLRGYDVVAKANVDDFNNFVIRDNIASCYINPETLSIPHVDVLSDLKNEEELFNTLYKMINDGQRWQFACTFKEKDFGHTVCLTRMKKNLVLIDPQTGGIISDQTALLSYFSRINFKHSIETFRIDNLYLNYEILDYILTSNKKQEDKQNDFSSNK